MSSLRLRTLDAVGQAPLVRELVQVRGKRDGRQRSQAPAARRPTPGRAVHRRCGRHNRAPRSTGARARGGGRCTRRASPRGRGPAGRAPGRAARDCVREAARARPGRAARLRSGAIKTLPSPRTASPVNATSPKTKETWSGAWPGVDTTSSGPNSLPCDTDVDLAAGGSDRRVRESGTNRRDGLAHDRRGRG